MTTFVERILHAFTVAALVVDGGKVVAGTLVKANDFTNTSFFTIIDVQAAKYAVGI